MPPEIRTGYLSNTNQKPYAPNPLPAVGTSVCIEFHKNESHTASLTASELRAAFIGALNGPAARLLALGDLAHDVRRAAYTPLTHRGSRDSIVFFVQNIVRNTNCES
jgi:hypothetical protein